MGKFEVSSYAKVVISQTRQQLSIRNSQLTISKEGVVKKFVNSPLRLTVFAIIFALALTACVRPLQEEDPATPTPDPAQAVPTAEPEQPPPAEPEAGDAETPPTEGEGAGEGEAGTGEEGGAAPEDGTEAPADGSTEQPPPEAESPTPPPPADPVTGERVHIVQRGENLFRIGLQYGIPYQTLAAYNGIPNAHLIYEGQAIRIPGSG